MQWNQSGSEEYNEILDICIKEREQFLAMQKVTDDLLTSLRLIIACCNKLGKSSSELAVKAIMTDFIIPTLQETYTYLGKP